MTCPCNKLLYFKIFPCTSNSQCTRSNSVAFVIKKQKVVQIVGLFAVVSVERLDEHLDVFCVGCKGRLVRNLSCPFKWIWKQYEEPIPPEKGSSSLLCFAGKSM